MLSYQLNDGSTKILYIHQKNNITSDIIRKVDNVVIDGDELEHLKKNMTNIPFHNTKRVQIWYGDLAKFIVANF